MCVVPHTGMMFIANENTKIQTHYIPVCLIIYFYILIILYYKYTSFIKFPIHMKSLGPAPKWCGFLDTLVEELGETIKETVYDDYKFATRNELEEIGLSHLIGKKYVLTTHVFEKQFVF